MPGGNDQKAAVEEAAAKKAAAEEVAKKSPAEKAVPKKTVAEEAAAKKAAATVTRPGRLPPPPPRNPKEAARLKAAAKQTRNNAAQLKAAAEEEAAKLKAAAKQTRDNAAAARRLCNVSAASSLVCLAAIEEQTTKQSGADQASFQLSPDHRADQRIERFRKVAAEEETKKVAATSAAETVAVTACPFGEATDDVAIRLGQAFKDRKQWSQLEGMGLKLAARAQGWNLSNWKSSTAAAALQEAQTPTGQAEIHCNNDRHIPLVLEAPDRLTTEKAIEPETKRGKIHPELGLPLADMKSLAEMTSSDCECMNAVFKKIAGSTQLAERIIKMLSDQKGLSLVRVTPVSQSPFYLLLQALLLTSLYYVLPAASHSLHYVSLVTTCLWSCFCILLPLTVCLTRRAVSWTCLNTAFRRLPAATTACYSNGQTTQQGTSWS